MADYKDYIVRYDIQADVSKATQGLTAIAEIAKQFEGPMNALKEAIGTVNSAMLSLKENSQLKFEPRIDVRAFNNQLKGMVLQVRSAAAEMHTALFEALQGNPQAMKGMQKGIGQSLGVKSIKDLKSDIEAYEKELDKLMGTRKKSKTGKNIREKDGSILMAKNAGMQDRVVELEGRKTALQNLLRQRRAELNAAEQLEKEAEAARAKAAKASKKASTAASTSTTSAQAAKLTNVTPATIRAWKQAFGDAKNKALTINIRGNAKGANGALTVITEIQSSLRLLQEQASFTINPVLNMEGFAAAEAQLKQLASLSAAVTAPFGTSQKTGKTGKGAIKALTKDEQLRLTQAQQNAKAFEDKMRAVQTRLQQNQEKYQQNPTPGLKGQITRDTKKLQELKDAKAVHERTIAQLQPKTTQAVQDAAQKVKPLGVDIIGNLTGINAGQKEFVVPIVGELTKIQNKVKEAIPVNVKIMADQVAESLRSVPRPTLIVDVRLNTEGVAQQLSGIGKTAQGKKATPKPKNVTTAPVVAPTPQSFPPLTAEEQAILSSTLPKIPALEKAQEQSAKQLAAAQAAHTKSGGSNRTFDRLRAASKQFGIDRDNYLNAFNTVKPLMQKQFQSTAARQLTEAEIAQGLQAQTIVDQLSAKKRLNASQKTQLSEAQSTLTALRAPATVPPTTPKPVAPVAPVTQTTVAPTGKTGKAQPLAIDVMANVTGVKSAAELTIPVIGELTKVVAKLTADTVVPVVGELTKVVSKISSETYVPVVGEVTKVVSKITSEVFVPVIGEITKTVAKGKTEQVAPVIGELNKVVTKVATDVAVPVIGELTKVVSKVVSETFVPVVGELTKVVSKVTSETLVPVVGELIKVTPKLSSETIIPVVGEMVRVINKVTSEIIVPVVGEINKASIESQFKTISRPTLPVNMKLVWENGAIGKNAQLKELSQKIPPLKVTLDISQALTTLNELVAQIKAKSPQNIAITASGTSTSAATSAASKTTNIVGSATSSSSSKSSSSKTKTPPTAQERYESMKSKAVANVLNTKQKVAKWQEYNQQANNYHAQRQAMYDRLWGIHPNTDWVSQQAAQRQTELSQMRADAQSAFSKGLTPYEKQIIQQNTAAHQRRAGRLMAQASNAMIPFAQNQSQVGMLVKHRKFFKQAVQTTGIMPTADTQAPQMLRYLQGVSTQMQRASVAVPWQLQSQINKLQSQINKANGIAPTNGGAVPPVTPPTPPKTPSYIAKNGALAVTERPGTFYDRARKFAYPFTGNTSFGARTPMAVDMAKGMGVMFAVGGAMSAVGDSFSQAMQYQNTMRTTNAILKNGTDTYSPFAFTNMERTVRDVGVKTKFSAPEVANAARFLAMAGYDIPAINNAIRPIADLALIGDTDLGETADKMTNIMTTFGIKPEKMRAAANIMTTTATRSNTDLMMLAESAKYGGGVAKMYGYNDPNLFADTMALFGVMGNAGIQSSSAGTALRMIYQNIFKPNKNQKAVLDQLNKNYGITTTDKNGKFRSISDIIIEMAQRVPQDEMAKVVGNLFRITAQPGAAAALRAAAQEDGSDAEQVSGGIDAVSKFIDKNGLSSLAQLMIANRESVNGNISGVIAGEKQNTIQGLWAQATSTFTEGIVKAFESNENYFAEMLKDVRDYLAKPEMAETFRNVIDLIVELGKLGGWFVQKWVAIYNVVPGLVKTWMWTQMLFTQLGTLVTPFVSLIGVVQRLHATLMALSGAEAVSGASTAVRAATTATRGATVANTVNTVATVSPFMMGQGIGKGSLKGKAAAYKAQANKWETAIMGAMATYGFTGSDAKNIDNRRWVANDVLRVDPRTGVATSGDSRVVTAMDNKRRYLAASAESTRRYAEVQERAKRIYGTQARIGRAFNAARAIDMASMGMAVSNIKNMFSGLLVNLARAFGLLFNPITIAIGLVGALAASIYLWNKQQKEREERDKNAIANATREAEKAREKRYKSGADLHKQYINDKVVASALTPSGYVQSAQTKANQFYNEYKDVLTKTTTSVGMEEANKSWTEALYKHENYQIAFGDKNVNAHTGANIKGNQMNVVKASAYSALNDNPYTQLEAIEHARSEEAGKQRLTDAMTLAGASSNQAIEAQKKIIALRQQLMAGTLTQAEFMAKATAIREATANPNAQNLFNAAGMSIDEAKNRDWSMSKQYQQGMNNVLLAEIEGRMGSLSGYIQAEADLKKGLQVYSDNWREAIAKILALREGSFEGVKYHISMLPTGQVDYEGILTQLKNKIKDFNMTMEKFASMTASSYAMLAELGVVSDTSYAGFMKFNRDQNKETPLTKADYQSYYKTLVAQKPNSQAASMGENAWVKSAMEGSNKNLWAGRVRNWASDNAAIRQKKEYDKKHPKVSTTVTNTPGNNGKGDNKNNNSGSNNQTTGGNGGNGGKSTTNQSDYASHYDRSSARPTQVVINIDKLANFDRTMIASSAEERDLISAMESRITEAVYRVFAEAANSANNIIDRT